MTTAIYKPENAIEAESYRSDELQHPVIDFISVNPRCKGLGKHGGMRDLKIWQEHFRSMKVPFAVCKHGSQWKLWKHLNVPYCRHDVERSKGVFGENIEAVCPRCQKIHTRLENWKGRGMPHFYCPDCEVYLGRRSGGLDDAGEYHKSAAFAHTQGRS